MEAPILYNRISPKVRKAISEHKNMNPFSFWAEIERALLKHNSANNLTLEQCYHIFQIVHPEQKFDLSKLFRIFSYENKQKKSN